ncbi:glutamine-hydrolyzing carbamoyl-phosphate synthase small subunit [Lactobacillus sp. S2-2]|uniref:glutamine-hydrolyzing carbamoyl-phosphate synthase small subunit n=1 Tax=Lactobacillus sp. S2-2 TaxID=2692917 RepID=UPI001F0325EC|nr:glutamine-hydrolyzing carbamoyl-phosphate synthase small subunit [Lactobacillus sp. S2-2]MCF6515295.1 glutamine-hydrolyzing carbamoyl-phosphate synthase small subunit [Lactobacillus sp. S2-2]
MKRYLVLEDGQIYTGEAFGDLGNQIGELVFSTGMSGYQQSISDQSYNGEILMFTNPLIGNYGVNDKDLESLKPTTKGVVVTQLARKTTHFEMTQDLDEYCKSHQIPGIKGVDTRAITKHIREKGAMKAAILNDISDVSINDIKTATNENPLIPTSATKEAYPAPSDGPRVVVVDFGLKYSILRELAKRNFDVIVVPPTTSYSEIMKYGPKGVMLTNGPGDPSDVTEATLEMIRKVEKEVPMFGICMGHQLFALANGATTFKMKFGHRGFNHAVRTLENGKINFTSQNHGYAVERNSVYNTDLEVSHEEINDETVEGLVHTKYPAFSLQFHPDAAPGPHDADYIFDEFKELIQRNQKENLFNA